MSKSWSGCSSRWEERAAGERSGKKIQGHSSTGTGIALATQRRLSNRETAIETGIRCQENTHPNCKGRMAHHRNCQEAYWYEKAGVYQMWRVQIENSKM